MAPHSSTLAWEIPWTEEPGRLQSMGFSRQENYSGLPFPTTEDLPDSGIKPCLLRLLHWLTDSLPLVPLGKPPPYWNHI